MDGGRIWCPLAGGGVEQAVSGRMPRVPVLPVLFRGLVLRAVVLARSCEGLHLRGVLGILEFYRAIRTARLRGLLHFDLRPIDVMVYHGPRGGLVLRGVSRLDAFSGYPVRT